MATEQRTAQRRARRRRNAVVMGGAVAVVAAGGGVAWAMTGGSATAYRLAAVSRATVHQTVATSGTVSSVNSATMRFPVAGTVAAVDVHLGSHVTAGQTVATLDTSSLQQQLRDVQATAASARQTLASDEASQTSGSSSSSSPSSSSSSSGSTPTPTPTRSSPSGSKNGNQGSSGAASTALAAQVRAAQQKVIADQRAADLDADVAAADKAVAAANTACAALLSPTVTPTPTATPTTSASATSTDTASAAGPDATDLQSCQDAITAVQAAQHAVQADIDALTTDEAALDRAVSGLLRSLASSGSGGGSNPSTGSTPAARASAASSASTATGNAAGNGSQRSAGSGSGGSGGSGSGNGGVASAADLAADQARIDAADAQVTVAQQDLAQAALTTPISGTVGAMSITAGDQVSAGSSTATITVIGSGQKEVTTTIGIADVELVKKGEAAHVTVDGTTTPITGQVTQVGFLNTSGTSGSTTTYPVTIVLSTTQSLYDGAGASVAIDVGSATNVLTVPSSAVHKTGRFATVSVYRNGKVSTTPVTLGVQDSDRTEIRSGVAAGDQVVLADVSAAVPTSDVASNLARRFGATGGLGGGLGGSGGGGGVRVAPGGK